MDIFSMDGTTYDNGKIINGIKDVVWVERYNDAGEFSITGKPTAYFLNALSEGTLISHVDTESVMMVETQEIDDTKEGDGVVKISGRTVDEIAMENRVVTLSDHVDDPFDDDLIVYPFKFELAEDDAWAQALILLDQYLETCPYSSDEVIPNFHARSDISAADATPTAKIIPRLSLLSTAVRDLLTSIDAGLKVERPNAMHPTTLEFAIHGGVDLTDTVQFSWVAGDLDSARYVKSIKDYKNSGFVAGENYGIRKFEAGMSGFDLRIMPVEANDFDALFGSLPPLTVYYIFSVLGARFRSEVSKHKQRTLIDTKISKNARYKFGADYNIGDIVDVIGNYGISATMRVVEYARSMDESGDFGFPTLEPI